MQAAAKLGQFQKIGLGIGGSHALITFRYQNDMV
jgi:hypothetical protein